MVRLVNYNGLGFRRVEFGEAFWIEQGLVCGNSTGRGLVWI
jgi:hypothetical protein